MNIFDIIKGIYMKDKGLLDESASTYMLNKWLSFDSNNLKALSIVLPYQVYITSKHYIYLLFFHIRKENRVPFLKYIKEEKAEKSNLHECISCYFDWSEDEYLKNKLILEIAVNPHERQWLTEFGLKK